MRFTTPLLLLGLSAFPIFAQDASSIQASLSSLLASATSDSAALSSAASAEVYSLTHCNPSFASWYSSVTSVLATETNEASLSAFASSLKASNAMITGACEVTASPGTALTFATPSGASAAATSAAGSGTASAAATGSTATAGSGSLIGPAMGMGGAFVLAVAAWL